MTEVLSMLKRKREIYRHKQVHDGVTEVSGVLKRKRQLYRHEQAHSVTEVLGVLKT